MNSEVAAYISDVLADPAEMGRTGQGAAAVSSDLLDNVTRHPAQASGKRLASVDEVSDEALLEHVSKGTKEALGILFRRHARTVRNVAHRILRNEEEADDLVQDVFLFIYRKAALFIPGDCTARSWIVQIAYHRAFDRRRHLITRHFYTSQEIDDAALNMVDGRYEILFSEWSMEAVWGRDWIESVVALLTPSQFSTIELHFFEGYTFPEIADRLGLTLSNTYHHYYRGLEKLRRSAVARKLRPK